MRGKPFALTCDSCGEPDLRPEPGGRGRRSVDLHRSGLPRSCAPGTGKRARTRTAAAQPSALAVGAAAQLGLEAGLLTTSES